MSPSPPENVDFSTHTWLCKNTFYFIFLNKLSATKPVLVFSSILFVVFGHKCSILEVWFSVRNQQCSFLSKIQIFYVGGGLAGKFRPAHTPSFPARQNFHATMDGGQVSSCAGPSLPERASLAGGFSLMYLDYAERVHYKWASGHRELCSLFLPPNRKILNNQAFCNQMRS